MYKYLPHLEKRLWGKVISEILYSVRLKSGMEFFFFRYLVQTILLRIVKDKLKNLFGKKRILLSLQSKIENAMS